MVSLPSPALIASIRRRNEALVAGRAEPDRHRAVGELQRLEGAQRIGAVGTARAPIDDAHVGAGQEDDAELDGVARQAAVSEPAAPARMSSPPLPRNVLALPSPVSVSANAEPLALSMPTNASVPPYPLLPPVATLIETAAGAAE